VRGSPLRFLLETVQHIDCVFEFGDVDHAERASLILNPDFLYTRADGFYRFPVIRFFPVLNLVNLITGFTTGRKRKVAQVVQRTTDELNQFV